MIQVIPGIQTNSFEEAQKKLDTLSKFPELVKLVHIDVCDGRFVDNLTIGAAEISKLKTKLPFNLHLMIKLDGDQIFQFERTSAQTLIFYPTATSDPKGIISQIKWSGKKVGIALDPVDSVESVERFLTDVDLVLVLAVSSGFAGQKFQAGVLPKISEIRNLASHLKIGVDGGVEVGTAKLAAIAGADFVVSNTFIWEASSPDLGIWALKKDVAEA